MAQLTNLLQGPEPVDTAELHFKLQCSLKVFDSTAKYEEGHCCILAVSQYYGLVFVGNLNGFSVISTKSLTAGMSPDGFPRRNVVLNLRPTHISVDLSQKYLVVVCNSKSGSDLIFYGIRVFNSKEAMPFKVSSVSSLMAKSTAQVTDLTWQPNADGSFVVCLSDGSVLALPQGTKNETAFTLPASTQATCLCWSPKGKQIVIGTATGTLSQYKPDLKLVKTLPPPPLFNGAVVVVSVLWISSFQFAVAYNDRSNPELFPVITIVNANKNEPVNVINYGDIPYSNTLFRNHQIYMSHQPAWNLIFVSSANSIETAVLHLKDNASWEQWQLGDASRAELPLNPDKQDTFPLGWAFDYTSQESIPWGESTLPPMPRLLLVSDEGLLCVFNVVNAAPNAPQLCTPPQETLDQSQFTICSKPAPPPVAPLAPAAPAAAAATGTTPVQAVKGILGSSPNLDTGRPVFGFHSSGDFNGFTAKTQTKAPQDVAAGMQVQPQQPQVQAPLQPQPQPPVQAQQQHQPQPQIHQQPPTQPAPSANSFKVSLPLFPKNLSTFPPTLDFSIFSNAGIPPKPAVPQPPAGAFALQTSASQKDLFSGKALPQSTPIKQAEAPPEKPPPAPGGAPAAAGKNPEEPEPGPRAEEVPAKGESPELTAVDDSVYLNALQEEVEHFNSELQQLSARVGTLDVKLGTEEEKGGMKRSIEGLQGFWRQLKETTEGQSGEIHGVVMDLMEAFAWLENAKSRNLQRKNPSYIELKKSEELDPLNARHMSEISHLKYYIENQLKQLTGYLEKEWMDHQENYRNEIKSKMAVPPLEEVYKTMHYQLKILQKQKGLLEELKEKIAAKKRKNKCQSFLISSANPIHQSDVNANRVSELSKLAENLLQLKINREEDSPQPGHRELMKSRLAAISDRSKKLTRDKQTALRDALSERDMVRIRPVKTTLESSSFLRSLHLEKAAPKTPKPKPSHPPKQTAPPAPKQLNPPSQPNPEAGASKIEEKPPLASKPEAPKSVPPEKATLPAATPAFPKMDARSPLNSLSMIVSNIGNKSDTPAFTFRSSGLQKAEPTKDPGVFPAPKPEQKPDEPKTVQPFTFGASKPGESIFGKKEPIVFGAKPTFTLPSSITVVTKPEVSKPPPGPPNITIAPVTTPPTTSPFTFSAPASTPVPTSFTFTASAAPPPTSTPLPKVNFFAPKDPALAPAPPTTAPSLFPSSLFGPPKTTESSASAFTFHPPDTKPTPPNQTPPTPMKPTAETEDVNVVDVDEPKNPEPPPPEKPKDPPKASVPPTAFSPPASTKSPPTDATSTAPSAPTSAPAPLTSTALFFPRSLTVTLAPSSDVSSSTAPPPPPTTSTAPPPTTTSSVFSFSSVTTPIFFGQTTTPTTTNTTTTTTTTSSSSSSLFGTPTSNPTPFPHVSSSTPATNIFAGPTPASPPANIFGGSTPVKPTPAEQPPSTPPKTSENIFAPSTPTPTPTTTTAFPKPSTPDMPSAFPQQTDVDATLNLFGQLLTDKPIFGGSPSTPLTPNLFASPPAPTTTTSAFTSSFASPVFGHPTTTTAATLFGQPTTSTSNSFFGQTSFNAFAKGTPVSSGQTAFKNTGFSEPIFGSSVFGQGFKRTTNPPAFGTPSTSIFGGTPSSTAASVFQTPTTSTTFGSTTPGPFSGGTSTFGETTFGSAATFQKPLGGFGGSRVFGGSPPAPAFGGSPTFGGSHSFGSLPTFGSVSQGAFGQTTGSTTFENLANQNTVGFGNLAHQSQSQGFGGGFGSPTFENKAAFGGNSFSSWRSK